MAGKIIADQIQSTTAGTLDTKYVVNGSAKAWMHLNGTGTIAVQDSLNVSSVADNGTGQYTQNHTNGFSNALYSAQLMNNRSVTTNNSNQQHVDSTFTSSLLNILFVRHDNLASEDSTRVMTAVHGDLA